MDNGKPVMGMGQPQHIDSDPRAEPIHLKQEERLDRDLLQPEKQTEEREWTESRP
jgi:hypothetical protein